MPSFFTLSRDDVYDYLSCPKIVAIKSYRLVHPKPKRKAVPRREPAVSRALIGKIGETATALALSIEPKGMRDREVEERISKGTERMILEKGVKIDGLARQVLEDTVVGLRGARKYIREEYGPVQVVGNGICKNGPFPGSAHPDLVALSPKTKKPILIEVKNSPGISKKDVFQARFYNTVARETGVLIHEQRYENGRPNLDPKVYHDSITEMLLIRPRAETCEKVAKRLNLKMERLKDIWEAKQLGLIGKSPSTGCDSECGHHRYELELPEDSLETAKPLPLIYAQGLREVGYDLDLEYLNDYLYSTGLTWDIEEEISRAQGNPERRKKLLERFEKETGIPNDLLQRMLFEEAEPVETRRVLKEMAGDIEPWEDLLNRKWMEKVRGSTVKSLASSIYTLPEGSEDFVKKSWKKW